MHSLAHTHTQLHVAAANGYTEVLQFLLPKEGLNLNIQDNEGWTPLHAAVCWGQKEAMRMLVEKGANMDAKNLRGETPYGEPATPTLCVLQYILGYSCILCP